MGNFFHNSISIIGSRKTQFYGDHAHLGGTSEVPNMYFSTSKALFFTPDDVINGIIAQKHIFENG